MITCSEAVDQLWHYLESELSHERRAEMEEHLAFCRRCCGEAEFADELRRFLAEAARPQLPDHIERRLTTFLGDLDQA